MKSLYLRLGFATFALFGILTLIVASGVLKPVDYNVTIYLQKIIPRALDAPFSVFSLWEQLKLRELFFYYYY